MSKPMAGLYGVRLSIDGIRHTIENMLIDHDGTMKASIEHEMNAAIAAFDWSGEVKRQASDELKKHIRNVVVNTIAVLFREKDIKKLVQDAIVAELSK